MILRLDRRYKKDTYTVGVLYVDGKYFADTIEDRDRGLTQDMKLSELARRKVYGQTAIPTGRYRIDMDTVSPKFKGRTWAKAYGGVVPRLVDVPCYSGVLIHPFNTAEESKGCIAVGRNLAKGKVLYSTKYFRRLMDEHLCPAHRRGEAIEIEIV